VGGGGASIVVKSLRSNAELIVRQSPVSNDVKKEAKEATALEAVTRQPVKTQQVEKT
jgi:aminoglycoside phosphotransferase (APT) family kinase protein